MAKHREIPAPDPVIESDSEEYETEESDSEPEPQPAKNAPAAAKLQKPLAKAPAPAESSDSETEESDSEPEPEPAKKPEPEPAMAAALPADSSSGSEYESDSDDGLPPKKPDSNGTNVKPITSKPMATEKDAVPVKTATAKAAKAPAPATPATGMKRSATPSVTQEADTKRSKIENSPKKGAATEEGKKLFERIFTAEDEIIVLEELLKKYPISKESSEMDSVYEAIKGRVSVPVSKAQVQDKIRRLRVKFFNKKEKFANKKEKKKKGSNTEEEGGKDELETVAYVLSKKIWGNEEGPKTGSKGSTSIAMKFEEAVEKDEGMENKKEKEKSGLSFARDGKSVEDWVFGEGTELVAEEARGNLEKEWKEIRKEEAQLYMKKLELSLKHAKIVYDSMSS